MALALSLYGDRKREALEEMEKLIADTSQYNVPRPQNP